MDKKKKHNYKRTEIEHHADKSHTVRHVAESPEKSKSYATANLDGVHDGMQDNLNPSTPAPTGAPLPSPVGISTGAAPAAMPGGPLGA